MATGDRYGIVSFRMCETHGSARLRVITPNRCPAYMQCIKADGATRHRRQRQSDDMFTTFILSRIRGYLKYRETVRQLSLLTDRELEDIGVARFQIDALARTGRAA